MDKISELYAKYNEWVLYKAYQVLENTEDAAEILRRTFVKLEKHISCQDVDKAAYLIMIVSKHCVYNFLKQKGNRDAHKVRTVFDYMVHGGDECMNAVNNLEDRYKDILFLKLVFGYTDRETAFLLDIPWIAVRLRFFMAKARIRRKIMTLHY